MRMARFLVCSTPAPFRERSISQDRAHTSQNRQPREVYPSVLTLSTVPHTDLAPTDLPDADASALMGEALREAMRRVPSPVVVVTAASDRGVRGATIGSFTSVSLDPPLISFNVQRESRLHAVLEHADSFIVNVLGAEHASTAEHFARPDLDDEALFAAVPHDLGNDGAPQLKEAPLVMVVAVRERVPTGDHILIVGEVMLVDKRSEMAPLVYFNQAYRSVSSDGDSSP
ncbi:hypothetical protein BH23BAC4_BH23BAC4_12530 [soil metagenome]